MLFRSPRQEGRRDDGHGVIRQGLQRDLDHRRLRPRTSGPRPASGRDRHQRQRSRRVELSIICGRRSGPVEHLLDGAHLARGFGARCGTWPGLSLLLAGLLRKPRCGLTGRAHHDPYDQPLRSHPPPPGPAHRTPSSENNDRVEHRGDDRLGNLDGHDYDDDHHSIEPVHRHQDRGRSGLDGHHTDHFGGQHRMGGNERLDDQFEHDSGSTAASSTATTSSQAS